MMSKSLNYLSDLMNVLRKEKLSPIIILLFASAIIVLAGCDSAGVSNSGSERTGFNTDSEWLVPEHEVVDGGPGKDGIPPIENPEFKPADQISFIPDERRVLGMIKEGEPVAYPHQVLDWHEIVNDDTQVTITYCPLTATGIAWNPQQGPSFGTSGLIFRNNLIAYDRKTESLWSQMRLRAINGEHLGASINPLNMIDTTWETWKKLYPDSKVLTTNTGHSRDYRSYAYGRTYSENDGIILFPTTHENDDRLNAKARVHGVFVDDELDEDSTVRVYEISQFRTDIEVVHDVIEGERYVIIGSSGLDFAIAYKANLGTGEELTFEAVRGELPIVMQDQNGTKWTVFGEAAEGPSEGSRLGAAKSYSGYWFAFRDMFELPEIYSFEN